MHPRLRRLKQPKPVWLQFVHDRRTAPETSVYDKRALWLVLVYEEEHDCADGADSERTITSEKSIKNQNMCAAYDE
jgi:hypothetical protein